MNRKSKGYGILCREQQRFTYRYNRSCRSFVIWLGIPTAEATWYAAP